MITTKGKGLIARALSNQLQSPFSYIALGVGPKPLYPPSVIEETASVLTSAYGGSPDYLADGAWAYETDTGLVKQGDGVTAYASLPYISSGIEWESYEYLDKTRLDFEALRIPVSGSSVVYEGGQTKVVLTGSLPSTQRFEFSEIGIFSAEKNALLTTEPSKMIYTFSASEGWEYHSDLSVSKVRYLGSISENNTDITLVNPETSVEEPAFIGADNSIFYFENRKNQRLRVYQDALVIPGNMSTINTTGDEWDATDENHVHVVGIPVTLSKARPDDVISLSFSIMNNINSEIATAPAVAVDIMVVFKNTELSTTYAKFQAHIEDGTSDDSVIPNPASTSFTDNGYFVVSIPKSGLITSPDWIGDDISVAQVYVQVTPDASKNPEDYSVAIDAIRFDSNNDNNPTYGMSAYSVVQNASASTELKEYGTETQIEYKIVLEV